MCKENEGTGNELRRDLLTLIGGVGIAGAGLIGLSACVPASQAMPTPDERDQLTGDEMVGKKLRIVRPGVFVTQEFDADRVTINLDEGDRIVGVRLG